jgi:predicted dehydrogenase/threonine dehydrogenase-like Zn-dependent dehydrogenase
MKQILQNLRSGETVLAEVPAPIARPGGLLIQTRASLISLGTERMLVSFGQANWLEKARQQPDKVKQVIDKIKTDGLFPTLDAVRARLDQPLPLGYCNAGVVLEVGAGVSGFKPGDRVASNGPHAEIVWVPKHLCAKVPPEVSDEAAAFTVLASIGLQGLRLAGPTLGEKFVVYGLGLIGLLTTQLLRANGCEVLGIDINPERLPLAKEFGALTFDGRSGADPLSATRAWTEGKGVDAVIVTASAPTDEIMHQAAQMCRKRGRLVLIGVVGLNLRRSDFYEKELSFQVSCSYGPGRYDEGYEQGGHDYPLGFVRWTEQRNFQAVLELMRAGRLTVERLITHRLPLAGALSAYQRLGSDPNALGVVLQYPAEAPRAARVLLSQRPAPAQGQAVVGVIGAGNFSKMTLLPALSKTPARIAYVADLDAVAARHLAAKYKAENAVTDYRLILQDPEVNAVFIAVGHDLHARFVCEVLQSGKHAFVEKPLAMNADQLKQILAACAGPQERSPKAGVGQGELAAGGAGAQTANPHLMVGFNRRFSPHTLKIKQLLAGRSEPLALNMTVNAGIIPSEHWVHDPVRGGGRIIGEACHFIDLMVFLTGSLVRSVAAHAMGMNVAVKEDKMSISLGFEDGSVGTVNYFANGSRAYPKERLEVFSEGRVIHLDNFRRTTAYGFRRFGGFRTWRQDKGHAAEFAAFVRLVTEGGPPLIPLGELVNVTLASFAAMTAANETRTVVLAEEYAGI